MPPPLAARKKVAKLAVKDRESALFGVDADSLQASSGGPACTEATIRAGATPTPTCCRRNGASTSRKRRGTIMLP